MQQKLLFFFLNIACGISNYLWLYVKAACQRCHICVCVYIYVHGFFFVCFFFFKSPFWLESMYVMSFISWMYSVHFSKKGLNHCFWETIECNPVLTSMFSLYCIQLLIYNMVLIIEIWQVIVQLPGKKLSFSSSMFFKHVWKAHVPHFRAVSQKANTNQAEDSKVIIGVFLLLTPHSCSAHMFQEYWMLTLMVVLDLALH